MIKKEKGAIIRSYVVEFDREEDGRWIAEIPKLLGVMSYGATKKDAERRVYAVALRTLAYAIENKKVPIQISSLFTEHGMARR
ncbi:type II toxin-antitoxin system HicB family antitoxin [bacterium]|nr:type II toxin-antitoxin system HicB family antitoxin [bacterium]